jgi:hypothetical protein
MNVASVDVLQMLGRIWCDSCIADGNLLAILLLLAVTPLVDATSTEKTSDNSSAFPRSRSVGWLLCLKSTPYQFFRNHNILQMTELSFARYYEHDMNPA